MSKYDRIYLEQYVDKGENNEVKFKLRNGLQ